VRLSAELLSSDVRRNAAHCLYETAVVEDRGKEKMREEESDGQYLVATSPLDTMGWSSLFLPSSRLSSVPSRPENSSSKA
jgi:hypothetical protein